MPKRKNACPNCENPLRETTIDGIIEVWFAGRDLTAKVRCGECQHVIVVGGTAASLWDDTEMDA